MWKVKMHKIIIQQNCVDKPKDEDMILTNLTQSEKIEIMYKKMSVIILCLGDKVLRELITEKTMKKLNVFIQSYQSKFLKNELKLFNYLLKFSSFFTNLSIFKIF